MLKPFKTATDLEIASQIFDGVVHITHDHGEGASQDIRQALAEIVRGYESMSEEVNMLSEMERHIEKLEAMLDRRNVKYKRWEDD